MMKTIKYTLFTTIVTLFSFFTSCKENYINNGDDNLIWDFACYSINFMVTDTDGHDLLSPHFNGNILNNDITVTYNNNKYIKKSENEITLRFLMPQELAIRTIHDEINKKNYISFGEFTPCDDFKNETFTIDWGDGTKDEIKFDLYITWDNPKKPVINKRLLVNGKEIKTDESGFNVSLTKNSNFNDDIIWDFTTFNVNFFVSDKEGNDLINPDSKENILKNDITVTYNDKEYKYKNENKITPRLNLPAELAIRTFYYNSIDKFYIAFGEFTPIDNLKNETFTIDWGDGTKDEIKFDLYITWESPTEPIVHKKLYINDKEEEVDFEFFINIVK